MGTATRGETGTNGSYRGYRARLGARIGGAAAIGGAVLASVFVMMAPAATAMLTNGTNTAPYTGVKINVGKSVAFSGCATAKGKKGVWAPSTGIGGVKAFATAKQCSFPAFTSYGDGSSFVEAALSAGVTSTGTYTVDVNVTYTTTATLSVINGSCAPAPPIPSGGYYSYSYCSAAAEYEWFIQAWMVDGTNGTYYYGSYVENFTYTDMFADNYCYSSGCAWSNSSFSFGFANAPATGTGATDLIISPYYSLDSTHSYWVFVEADAFAYASVYGYSYPSGAGYWSGGAIASASANLASLGNTWDLNYVSIT